MISIRRRLLLGTVLAVAVSSAVASGAAWFSVRAQLIAAADTALCSDALRLLGQLRRRGGEIHWAGLGSGSSVPFDGWWVVVDASGAVLASSAAEALPLVQAADGVGTMPDGCDGRMCRVRGAIAAPGRGRGAESGDGGACTLLVARSDTALERTMLAVGWALGAATLVATLLAGVVAWMLARAVVRPIDRIAGAIAAAKPEDERIALRADEVPRELRPVVERADAFLAMSRDLVQRERQTAGNIAHELRTPLAGLAAVIDLAMARERGAAEYRQALERSRGIVTGTAGIVERLLLLTRLESGREPVRPEDIALPEMLASVQLAVADEAARRRIALPESAALSGLVVRGDPGHLRLLLGNLLDNAVAHAPEGSAITLVAETAPDRLRISLGNPAPGLDQAMLAHLDQAFWRGEEGRGATGRHAGLGLTLCRRLAVINGWELDFLLREGVFTANVTLQPVV